MKDMIQLLVAKVKKEEEKTNKQLHEFNFELCQLLSVFSQFVAILDGVLAKISRYDEGTLFSSFLSFTVRLNFFFFFNEFLESLN